MKGLAIALGVALSWPVLSLGQMRSAGGAAPAVGAPQMGISHGLTISLGAPPAPLSHPFHHNFFPGVFVFDPEFWHEPVPPASPAVVVIPIELKTTEAREEAKLAEPLLIERRGDQFVRFREGEMAEATGAGNLVNRGSERALSPRRAQLPPAVLVFRDGHREQTSDYAIVGSELYLYFDPADGGGWFKKVNLSDLDLVATAAENRGRGSKFQLPRGPGEIVVRP